MTRSVTSLARSWRAACAIRRWERRVFGKRSIRSNRNCNPTASPCRTSAASASAICVESPNFAGDMARALHPVPGQIRIQLERPPVDASARIADARPARARNAACRGSTRDRPYPRKCRFESACSWPCGLYRPLIGIGVNEYHPSMTQSLKTKYLLLALGMGAGLALLLGGFAYYEHRIDSADIARLTYAAVEQKLEGDLEARGNSVVNVTGALLAPASGRAQQRRPSPRSPDASSRRATSSGSRSRMRAGWCCSAPATRNSTRRATTRPGGTARSIRWS